MNLKENTQMGSLGHAIYPGAFLRLLEQVINRLWTRWGQISNLRPATFWLQPSRDEP
jgi:hypothetical protein